MSDAHSMIGSRWRQGRLFVLALLLALASALVPALCSSGPPASRATGSAFDPTTSVVTLRGRMQALVQANPADRIAPTLPATGPFTPILLSAAPAVGLSATLLLYPLAWRAGQAAPRPCLRRITRARPRAPPHRVS